MAGLVLLVARVVLALCVLLLVALVVFDAQAERFTAGLTPLQFRQELDADVLAEIGEVVGVAHNAGDDLDAAREAAAYGVDAIEIDVRSVGGELHASHDAPVPVLDTLFFRGPELAEAWDVARLRDVVLLDLKESSPGYLEDLRRFLATRRDRPLVVQARDDESSRALSRTVPWVRRLLLLFDEDDVRRLGADRGLPDVLDGVSARERLLTEAEMRRFAAAGSTPSRGR